MTQPRQISFSLRTQFWLALILVVFVTVALRLIELPLWSDPALWVNGERLLATHDAYAWLAGTTGTGAYVTDPFPRLLSLTQTISGLSTATVAFWSPIIFIPLLALPICLLTRFLCLPEAGLVFGLLTTSSLGYLLRTRLGFGDTDVISMLFPVSVSCCLIVWLGGLIRPNWKRDAQAVEETLAHRQAMLLASAIGVLGKLALIFYPSSMSILLATYILTAVVGLFLTPKQRRALLGLGLLLMYAITFGGLPGTIIAGAWIWWFVRTNPRLQTRLQRSVFLTVLLAIFFVTQTHALVWEVVNRLFFYAKIGAPEIGNATALKLPDVVQSIREAQNLDWSMTGQRMGGSWLIFLLGLLGFGFLSWRRPALILFLPFIGLGLASMKLGNRFAMYGAVGIGLGLGLGLSELLRLFGQGTGRRWIAQLILACVVVWPSAAAMQEVFPVPVLPQSYAQGLLDLRTRTEPDALLWQWWDYGYAAQFYAQRDSFGDGAHVVGSWIYPLARVHAATSAHQAAQLMRYFAHAMHEEGEKNFQKRDTPNFLANPEAWLQRHFESKAQKDAARRAAWNEGNPTGKLQKMDAGQARKFLADLESQTQKWPVSRPHYLTMSWENLRLATWIGYYGHWDIVSGTSSPGRIQQLHSDIRVDPGTGILWLNEKSIPLTTLDVVQPTGTRHFDWPHDSRTSLIINQLSKQAFLMDETMYSSMMVQMLIAPPQAFAPDFTLVVDNYPWTRTYKVRQ